MVLCWHVVCSHSWDEILRETALSAKNYDIDKRLVRRNEKLMYLDFKI